MINSEKSIVNNNQFQNRRYKQLTKVRTRGVTALERSMANNLPLGFKPGSRVTNLTHAPTGSHINKQVQVVLVK
jgi:hypothetical protein